jgi:hypothetical protein
MSDRSLPSPRLLAGLIGAAAILFAVSLFLMSKGNGPPAADEAGASSFSRSALGYAGFAETLRELGATVVQSRYDSPGKLAKGSMLIIAEPRLSFETPSPLRRLLDARATLLILPKWQGEPSKQKPGWISSAEPRSVGEAALLLNMAVKGADVFRRDDVDRWNRNDLKVTPSIDGPVQLIRSGRLQPIVADGDGILVGELKEKGRRLYVLADPDVLANHGLGHGDNALFGLALVNALRGTGGGIVFDETLHGFATDAPSAPLPLLFKFPFNLATLQAVLAIGLLLWATMPRFGAVEKLAAPLDAGKLGLIRNSARLITFAGHRKSVARRYAQALLQDAASRLHLPAGLDEGELVDRLRRIGLARGVAIDCSLVFYRIKDLAADPKSDPALLASPVRDLHHWKQSIADEPSRRSSPR